MSLFLIDGKKLWSHIKDYNPIILSGVPRGGWAEEQKRRWCSRELGNTVTVILCESKNKNKYCTAGNILIDDRRAAGIHWEHSGGTFIHHKSAKRTILILEDILEKRRGQQSYKYRKKKYEEKVEVKEQEQEQVQNQKERKGYNESNNSKCVLTESSVTANNSMRTPTSSNVPNVFPITEYSSPSPSSSSSSFLQESFFGSPNKKQKADRTKNILTEHSLSPIEKYHNSRITFDVLKNISHDEESSSSISPGTFFAGKTSEHSLDLNYNNNNNNSGNNNDNNNNNNNNNNKRENEYQIFEEYQETVNSILALISYHVISVKTSIFGGNHEFHRLFVISDNVKINVLQFCLIFLRWDEILKKHCTDTLYNQRYGNYNKNVNVNKNSNNDNNDNTKKVDNNVNYDHDNNNNNICNNNNSNEVILYWIRLVYMDFSLSHDRRCLKIKDVDEYITARVMYDCNENNYDNNCNNINDDINDDSNNNRNDDNNNKNSVGSKTYGESNDKKSEKCNGNNSKHSQSAPSSSSSVSSSALDVGVFQSLKHIQCFDACLLWYSDVADEVSICI